MAVKRTTVTLAEPIEHAGETVTELNIRGLKAKDLRGLPIDQAEMRGEHLLTLLSRLAGVSEHVIGELGVTDLERASEAMGAFFGSGPATGET